jgi:acyl-CoA dehydrogenase
VDFDDTADEAAFRATARAWLDANAPKHLESELRRASRASSGITSEDPLAASKAWQKKKAAAGYACLHWPREYGGGGFSPIQRVIWQQEEGVYGLLSLVFAIGHGMCGPTLIAWADEAQKKARLPSLITGDEIWCQLFSEPAAGSDLAALRTRVERTADGSGDWTVNGQKIWTSGAQIADWGLLLARSDPSVAKHKGLTMFFLHMKSPGLEVHPIRQASGELAFSEVYFTGARIPDTQRLGMPGQGWEVALTTLMNERLSIGSRLSTGFSELFEFCCRLQTASGPAISDPAIRSRLASWAVRESGLKYTAMRAISALSRAETPGPENSVGKLVAAGMMQEIAAFALDLQGEAGVLADPQLAAHAARFQAMLLAAPAMRIAGGTDEIMRNVIAERVLGLPSEPRTDRR